MHVLCARRRPAILYSVIMKKKNVTGPTRKAHTFCNSGLIRKPDILQSTVSPRAASD